ncbi:MAG: hypothetical protein QXN87_06460 [Candidatus Bathyarchaeia archaeon]
MVDREKMEEFRKRLKTEWRLMWMERFDDRVRAEGVAVRDYDLLFVDRGSVIFASRDAKTPSFPEIMEYWISKGHVCYSDPKTGGWRKFIRTVLAMQKSRRGGKRIPMEDEKQKQQLKKGGRGWLHNF